MIKTGELDRRISIERRTDTRDDNGQPIPTWARIGRQRSAQRSPVQGDERFQSDQFIARDQIEWVVRWAQDISDLNPKDRIVYPVTSSPSDSEIYEIITVHEMGRREGLRIFTTLRPEV